MTHGQSKRLDRMNHRSAIKLLHIRVSEADKRLMQAELSRRGPQCGDPIMRGLPNSGIPNSGIPRSGIPTRFGKAQRQRMSVDRHRAHKVPGLSNFASWAFSPYGLPNLQVLAYGDFSYGGRYVEDTFVFGRDGFVQSSEKWKFLAADPKFDTDVGFSLLGRKDRNEVMARYGDFLEACPVDPLMQMDARNIEAETWSGSGNY